MHLDEKTLLLRQIASLRVEGQSWSAIAQDLKQPAEAVRKLVWENEEAYLPHLRRARNEFLTACCLDAVRALQQQLKSKDEKIRSSAANCLMRFEMARMRHQDALRKIQQKSTTASTGSTTKTASVPNASPSMPAPHKATPAIQAPSKTPSTTIPNFIPPNNVPTATKNPTIPVITSDEVLKWLNEKKVAV